jgi:regulator of replication initiation timing
MINKERLNLFDKLNKQESASSQIPKVIPDKKVTISNMTESSVLRLQIAHLEAKVLTLSKENEYLRQQLSTLSKK